MEQGKESLYWIFNIIIISITLVLIILILGAITNYGINAGEIESYVIRNKIIQDKDCLAYEDYRVILGTIDKNKFNEGNLNNCLNTNKGIILNLTYPEKNEIIEINKDLTDKVNLCYDETLFFCARGKYNVILKNGLEEIPATLIIDTIELKNE